MFCVLGNTIDLEVNIERVDFQYTSLKNDLMRRMFSVKISMLAQNSPGKTDGQKQKGCIERNCSGTGLESHFREGCPCDPADIYLYYHT